MRYDKDSTAGASQPCVRVRIGTYNVGVFQQMLTSKKLRNVIADLRRVTHTCVTEGELDIMCFCEFGGHLEGPADAGIFIGDMNFFCAGANISQLQNYVTLWNFNKGASLHLSLIHI